MRLCVFEDAAVHLLEPLTLTRPAWSLWCGASSLLERQRRVLAADEVGVEVRPELVDLCRAQHPRLSINDNNFLQGDGLVLANARWLPAADTHIDSSRSHVGLVDNQVAYVAAPSVKLVGNGPDAVESWLDQCRATLPAHEAGGATVDYLWDLVDGNPELLKRDWEWFHRANPAPANGQNVALLGPAEKLVVSAAAVVEPFVTVDTRQGPVLIDQGAVVQSFSRVEGPCYIGQDTWIVGAKVRGGTFGPTCRIGGEVEATIIQGHSNKYHDGFLGHSYIGEWVNLAAGTQTSDLRNDYGPIRVSVAGRRIATGRTKIGSFIGDHSKTGLGALLNTGSVIGVFSNLLPAGSLLPQLVPSFCQVNNGQIQERKDIEQIFATAATVMSRRGATFTDHHRAFFDWLYGKTSPTAAQRVTRAGKTITKTRKCESTKKNN
jgi:UDP-N-acetylglucosamine diphosphorylase/glucosamine-1-phosphate N-acetyltransferase